MPNSPYKVLKDKTILLVEDESIIRNNIASMLGFFFKDIYTAKDGYEGLDKYEKFHPDIIITDLKMPYMSGFELLEEVKKYSHDTYTIIVSAHTDTNLLIKAVNDNIDRYIVKPVTECQIFDTFDAYLTTLEVDLQQHITLYPGILLDTDERAIILQNQIIHLNKKEFLLLKLLYENRQHIVSYGEIERRVWQGKIMSLASLRSVVRDIRKKTGRKIIQNISGIGYKL